LLGGIGLPFALVEGGGAFWRLAGREGLGLVGRRPGLPARLLEALDVALAAVEPFLLDVDAWVGTNHGSETA
jgi:hypothetical protein